MSKTKSNKQISFIHDTKKSYIYVMEKNKQIGTFMWHYKKKKWVYEET